MHIQVLLLYLLVGLAPCHRTLSAVSFLPSLTAVSLRLVCFSPLLVPLDANHNGWAALPTQFRLIPVPPDQEQFDCFEGSRRSVERMVQFKDNAHILVDYPCFLFFFSSLFFQLTTPHENNTAQLVHLSESKHLSLIHI